VPENEIRQAHLAEIPEGATRSGETFERVQVQPLRDPSHAGTVEVSRAVVRDIRPRRNRLLWPARRVASTVAEV
jgi:hypothetical protein